MGYHYVPRAYLRQFCEPEHAGYLWQFDKEKLTFSGVRLSVDDIAQKRKYYDDDTEVRLNTEIELPTKPILERIAAEDLELSDDERNTLARYMATMMKRGPRHRAYGREIANESLETIRARLEESLEDPEDIQALDAAQIKFTANLPGKLVETIRSPWSSEEMVDAIADMRWRFFKAADGEFFLTSDTPVFHFTYYGLKNEDSEISFPISSQIALLGRKRATDTPAIVCNPTYARELNRRTIVHADRFVYSHATPEWAKDMAKLQPRDLSRIQW